VELATGNVSDRPWGATLAALWRRQFSGRLIVRSGNDRITIAFRHGVIISSTSTIQGDTDVAQRAARSFSFEQGTFVIDDEPHSGLQRDIDTRLVIFAGARFVMTEARLTAELRAFGRRFKLAVPETELAHYGIAPTEPVIARLRRGTTVDDHDRHATRAIVYALACCGALTIEQIPETTSGLAAGTERVRTVTTTIPRSTTTPPLGVRTVTPPHGARAMERPRFPTPSDGVPAVVTPSSTRSTDARAAAARGQSALDAREFALAIAALQNAVELDPNRASYRALLAWAEFCAATDKEAIAETTRQTLTSAMSKSEDPVMPVYYLACVARELGRDREALRLYQRVLHLDPDHEAARAEVKVLSGRGEKKSLFDRFRR
jgi:hypothetical protein